MYGSLWKQISESLQLCLVNKKNCTFLCLCVCVGKEKLACVILSDSDFSPFCELWERSTMQMCQRHCWVQY